MNGRAFLLFLSLLFVVCLPAATAEEMVLIRGNYWVNGIPGFGTNSFSALSGVYRIGESEFSVYLTKEALYFSGVWQRRPGFGDVSVFQRQGKEGFLVATPLDDNRGNTWFAVFLFTAGLERAGFSDDAFNRMLRLWTSRASYFLSLFGTSTDPSLPAVLEF